MSNHIKFNLLKEFPTHFDALREIENLRKSYKENLKKIQEESDAWRATAAGISQDLSNAEDEIESLQEICSQLYHAISCTNTECFLDWEGIQNWLTYRESLDG